MSLSIPAIVCSGCHETKAIGGKNPGASYFLTVYPATPNGNPDTTQAPTGDVYQCTCGSKTVVPR